MGTHNVDDWTANYVERVLSKLPDAELNGPRRISLVEKKAELAKEIIKNSLWEEELWDRFHNPGQEGYGLTRIKGLNGRYYPNEKRQFVTYTIR